MQGPIFRALVEIAALTGRAAADVPVVASLTPGRLLDNACADLSQKMQNRSREMAVELSRTAARLEEMVLTGNIGAADEIGES